MYVSKSVILTLALNSSEEAVGLPVYVVLALRPLRLGFGSLGPTLKQQKPGMTGYL